MTDNEELKSIIRLLESDDQECIVLGLTLLSESKWKDYRYNTHLFHTGSITIWQTCHLAIKDKFYLMKLSDSYGNREFAYDFMRELVKYLKSNL